jgi:hypothetical protein
MTYDSGGAYVWQWSQRPASGDLQDFCTAVFDSLRSRDAESLTRLSANPRDVEEYLRHAKEKHVIIDVSVRDDDSDEARTNASRKAVMIFRRSYEDILEGKLARYSARVGDELGDARVVLWIKKRERYRGILIWSVIPTDRGYRVLDWIGPISDPTKSLQSLQRKKAILESENPEGCVYPESGIPFEYEFVQ